MEETIESFQDLIFILEHSLRQPEEVIMNLDYWVAKKRYKQIIKFNEEQKKEMEKEANKNKMKSR